MRESGSAVGIVSSHKREQAQSWSIPRLRPNGPPINRQLFLALRYAAAALRQAAQVSRFETQICNTIRQTHGLFFCGEATVENLS